MVVTFIATPASRPVYLRDIASVKRGYKEREAITRINGRESVELGEDIGRPVDDAGVVHHLGQAEDVIPIEAEIMQSRRSCRTGRSSVAMSREVARGKGAATSPCATPLSTSTPSAPGLPTP